MFIHLYSQVHTKFREKLHLLCIKLHNTDPRSHPAKCFLHWKKTARLETIRDQPGNQLASCMKYTGYVLSQVDTPACQHLHLQQLLLLCLLDPCWNAVGRSTQILYLKLLQYKYKFSIPNPVEVKVNQ